MVSTDLEFRVIGKCIRLPRIFLSLFDWSVLSGNVLSNTLAGPFFVDVRAHSCFLGFQWCNVV